MAGKGQRVARIMGGIVKYRRLGKAGEIYQENTGSGRADNRHNACSCLRTVLRRCHRGHIVSPYPVTPDRLGFQLTYGRSPGSRVKVLMSPSQD